MSKAIATFAQAATLPAHLQQGAGLGNENVTADNLMLPKLDLIQQLSPQLDKTSPKYIEGAELGDIFDSLTGATYKSVFVINLFFETTYAVFKKRALGGGFEGSFTSTEEANQHLVDNALDPKQYDIVESAIHKCLMLDENGNPKQPVLIYMASSKMRVSNQWNTNIQLENKGADRFATVWTLTSVRETNRQNQPFQNFKVTFAGFAGEDLYLEARKNYYALKGVTPPAAEQ